MPWKVLSKQKHVICAVVDKITHRASRIQLVIRKLFFSINKAVLHSPCHYPNGKLYCRFTWSERKVTTLPMHRTVRCFCPVPKTIRECTGHDYCPVLIVRCQLRIIFFCTGQKKIRKFFNSKHTKNDPLIFFWFLNSL